VLESPDLRDADALNEITVQSSGGSIPLGAAERNSNPAGGERTGQAGVGEGDEDGDSWIVSSDLPNLTDPTEVEGHEGLCNGSLDKLDDERMHQWGQSTAYDTSLCATENSYVDGFIEHLGVYDGVLEEECALAVMEPTIGQESPSHKLLRKRSLKLSIFRRAARRMRERGYG